MSLSSFLDNALSEFEKDHQEPKFTYLGSELTCVPSTESGSMPLEVEGFEIQVDLTLIVRKSVLSSKPQPHKTLTFKGKDYKIVRVGEPASGSHWEVALKDINQA